ncbi:DUF2190 family protein [Rhodococcus hoagii]|nr:DUF2190 family protein [Prescottella equi]
MANECTPLFKPGRDVTVLTTTAVTGKTFVAVTGDPDTRTGLIKAGTAAAGARPFGVASRTAPNGTALLVLRGGILPVTAGAAITAGQEVEVGASGRAIPLNTGKSVGTAVKGAANGADVLIALH